MATINQMKPRWEKPRGLEGKPCNRCVFVGRYQKWDIYVCDWCEGFTYRSRDNTGVPESCPAMMAMAAPYYKNKKFTQLYYAMVKLMQ
jgi:hypothetical protein